MNIEVLFEGFLTLVFLIWIYQSARQNQKLKRLYDANADNCKELVEQNKKLADLYNGTVESYNKLNEQNNLLRSNTQKLIEELKRIGN